MLELIADQRKLLGLAVVLRLETKFLIQSIKSDLKNPDETIRSQFLERILQFLKEAIGFDGVHSYLVSGGFCQKSAADDTPTSTCLPAHPQALTATQTSGAATTSINFTSDALGQGSEHQLEVPDVDSNTSPSCPLIHVTSSRPRAAALAALARASGLSQPSTNKPHGLWLLGAPPEVTSKMVSAKIYGGPLERLTCFPNKEKTKNNFLINFIDPAAKAAFIAFTKTPLGRRYSALQPTRSNTRWCDRNHHGITLNPTVISATSDPVNPARRALIFRKEPGSVLPKEEILRKLRILGCVFVEQYKVEGYQVFPENPEAFVVFDMIEKAINIMELYRGRRLGIALFDDIEVVYGNDPCDRPIPMSGDGNVTGATIMPVPYETHNTVNASIYSPGPEPFEMDIEI